MGTKNKEQVFLLCLELLSDPYQIHCLITDECSKRRALTCRKVPAVKHMCPAANSGTMSTDECHHPSQCACPVRVNIRVIDLKMSVVSQVQNK